ncbi:Na+/H+ antiporter subunit E [candidate division KSB1 bacterium]|nr:Na+/H+ antiporter subunit E [candidate division KSB1 bacterium]
MTKTNHGTIRRLRNFAYLFTILFIIWLALTSNLHWQELSVGILIALILASYLHKNYTELGLPPVTFKRIAYTLIYVVVLFKEIVIANIDVAYRVIHPKMPIKPGIVVIKTGLKHDLAKMILANSITLTPGTFTLDILDDKLLIHWINVQAEETQECTKIIGEKFEKYLRVIFA